MEQMTAAPEGATAKLGRKRLNETRPVEFSGARGILAGRPTRHG